MERFARTGDILLRQPRRGRLREDGEFEPGEFFGQAPNSGEYIGWFFLGKILGKHGKFPKYYEGL